MVNVFLLVLLAILTLNSIKNNQQRELHWQSDGAWLITYNKKQFKAKIDKASVVTPFFTSLNLKLENNKKISVVLFRDNVDADVFRQLRVRMKVEGLKLFSHDTIH